MGSVRKLTASAPTKSCVINPLPTSVVKECLDELSPAISSSVNLSLEQGRFQQVVIDGATSDKFDIDFGLPQGSCIGLSLFSIYAGQLLDIVTQHLPTVHCYADDTKLYLAFRQGDRATQYSAVAAVEACIQDVREWVIKDKLKKKSETWVPGLMPTLQ